MKRKPIAIGVEDYKRIIDKNCYYVDKTLMIKDILDKGSLVNLFTRPRRFGKTLALSMIKTYFEQELDVSGEQTDNSHYFAGMKIQQAGTEYAAHMGKYPVISLSLKSAKQPDYEMAYKQLLKELIGEFKRHRYILGKGALLQSEEKIYSDIMNGEAEQAEYVTALKFLSDCLKAYHKRNVIILIDEYDVPLENAYFRGFYDQMVDFIRSLFESALKTNDSLEFAVVTGCLRISKESIFTGLNNLNINSILDQTYAEYFGFTQEEVNQMLTDYGLESKTEEVKEWYDGYLFGNTEVYNPWSLINYVDKGISNEKAFPKPYWSNTSSNRVVRHLIEQADDSVKEEIEHLIQGGSIERAVHEEITYEDIYKTPDNLWNFLFFTGYLKKIEERQEERNIYLKLAIPNEELLYIYENTVREWFNERIQARDLSALFQGILQGNAEVIQTELSSLLLNSISYMDSYENFYHGFLLGILMNLNGYKVTSNKEAGDGRYDISIEGLDGLKIPVIIEFKVADKRPKLIPKTEQALKQITDNRYDVPFIEDGYEECIHIGIGFCRKMCRVKCEMVEL